MLCTDFAVLFRSIPVTFRFMQGTALRSHPTLSAIQFMRAVAATAVVAVHVQYDLTVNLSGSLPVDLDAGQAGVDLFFVISGFVMVYSSEPLFGMPNAPATFFARRIIRIVPLYWLMTSLMLAYVVARGFDASDASPMLALASYFFVPYPRPSGPIDPLYGIGWTLNFEMFFYLVFAIALVATRRIVVVAITTTVFIVAIAINKSTGLPRQAAFLANPMILEFAIGMAFALIYRTGFRFSRTASLILLAAAIVEFACFNSTWFDALFQSNAARLIKYGMPAAQGFAALTMVSRDLAFRYVEKLGDASYSLYLTHPAIISIVRAASKAGYLDPVAAPWLYFFYTGAACICFAFAVHFFFEKPVTNGLKRRLDTPKPSLPRVTTV